MKAQPFIASICSAATLVAALQRPVVGAQPRPNGTRSGQHTGRINPSEHRQEIVLLSAPSQVEVRKPVRVAVTAADKDGVWYVEVRLGEELRRFYAGGDKVVSFTATFDFASFDAD